jgi:hypothetical protein
MIRTSVFACRARRVVCNCVQLELEVPCLNMLLAAR